jgi:hypothetical protein
MRRALAAGTDVVLTGIGGDEVLAAWNYLTPSMLGTLRRDGTGLRQFATYLGEFLRHDSIGTVLAELVALLEPRLPRRVSYRLYHRFSLAPLTRPLDPPVLTDAFSGGARADALAWVEGRARRFVDDRQTWPTAALWDAVYPFGWHPHPFGTPLPERAPFLDPDFVRFVSSLPWAARFDRSHAAPYHWYKSLHLRLLPPEAVAALPRHKQSYLSVFDRYVADVGVDTTLVEIGVLRPLSLPALERIHPRLPIVAHNLGVWARGALERGYAAV